MEDADGKADDVQSFRIDGRLVIADVAALKTRILDALQTCRELVLELDAVEECDTAGIQFLIASSRLTSRDGKSIRLGSSSDSVRTAAAKLGLKLATAEDKKEG